MAVQIPTSAVAWQEFFVVLDGQNCTIDLRQLGHRLYADLFVDGDAIFQGRICTIDSDINCFKSPKFHGYLFFVDTRGAENPQFEGLNDRWVLCYETEDERTERLAENG